MSELLTKTPSEIIAPLSYDTSFDAHTYQILFETEGTIPPQDFAQKLLVVNRELRTNLEADLAERFDVELHRARFRLTNGKIYHPSFDEPFIDTMRRGLVHRQNLSSKHDFLREAAEIESFAQMEDLLDGNSRIVIISPPGGINSVYQHNFVDVFEISPEDKKTLTLKRFTTNSTIGELLEIAELLLGQRLESKLPTDIALKKTAIKTTKNTQEIVSMFKSSEETMSCEEFRELKEFCAPAIGAYIQVAQDGASQSELEKHLKAIRKMADIFTGDDPYTNEDFRQSFLREKSASRVLMMPQLASMPQRSAITPCGISENASNRSPWTFAEMVAKYFSQSSKSSFVEKTLNCKCPFCDDQVDAEISMGKITCPKCHASAPYKC